MSSCTASPAMDTVCAPTRSPSPPPPPLSPPTLLAPIAVKPLPDAHAHAAAAAAAAAAAMAGPTEQQRLLYQLALAERLRLASAGLAWARPPLPQGPSIHPSSMAHNTEGIIQPGGILGMTTTGGYNNYPTAYTTTPYGCRFVDPRALLLPRVFAAGPEEPKPQHSYIGLIAMAILSHPDRKLVLSDIYQYILDNYPYFRSRGPGWRNSIRHNLSLNDCFIKSGRSANGKGHYWAIHPANLDDFRRGDFRRRRAQRRVRKHLGLAVDDDSEPETTNSPPPSDAGRDTGTTRPRRQFDVLSLLAPDTHSAPRTTAQTLLALAHTQTHRDQNTHTPPNNTQENTPSTHPLLTIKDENTQNTHPLLALAHRNESSSQNILSLTQAQKSSTIDTQNILAFTQANRDQSTQDKPNTHNILSLTQQAHRNEGMDNSSTQEKPNTHNILAFTQVHRNEGMHSSSTQETPTHNILAFTQAHRNESMDNSSTQDTPTHNILAFTQAHREGTQDKHPLLALTQAHRDENTDTHTQERDTQEGATTHSLHPSKTTPLHTSIIYNTAIIHNTIIQANTQRSPIPNIPSSLNKLTHTAIPSTHTNTLSTTPISTATPSHTQNTPIAHSTPTARQSSPSNHTLLAAL